MVYGVSDELQSAKKNLSAVDIAPSVSGESFIQEIRPGVLLETLEPRSEKKHAHIRGSLPDDYPIETSFSSGPVLTVFASNSTIDVANGLTLWKGQPIRETAVVSKLIDSYDAPSSKTARSAMQWPPERVMLPLASQRMANYCRWWIDSMSKIFTCQKSSLYRSLLASAPLDVIAPELTIAFQQQTVELLRRSLPVSVPDGGYWRGRSLNSPGLTYGGGQRLGTNVKEFAIFLKSLTSHLGEAPRSHERLYLTRKDTPMRRILNEEELLPDLQALGFQIIQPNTLYLEEQISIFKTAKIVVSAHGAALTNILFCRPGTTLVEIFPEGGVHGSMFLRMASHFQFNYYFVVGRNVDTAKSAKNPNNADILLDKRDFVSFLRNMVGC